MTRHSNLAAVAAVMTALPVLAQAGPGASVFVPMSTTAAAITGPLTLSADPLSGGEGSIDVTFGSGQSVRLDHVGQLEARWDMAGDGAGDGAGVGQVFRLAADPGALLQGNTLCGDPAENPARFAVFFAGGSEGIDPYLGLAVFGSADTPRGIDDPGLCGTYNYLPG